MPAKRTEAADDRRRQILEAAVVCFAEHGFHQTSMHDISAEAGISVGLIYRYFKNKDEVITLFAEQSKQDKTLAQAIWDEYVFNPVFDDAYVKDMEQMTAYLVASGRIKSAKNPLEYTFTAPLAAADPALVKVAGRVKV